MICRLIAVDPHPQKDRSDLLVYQLPENSREFELLTAALDNMKVEWTVVRSDRKVKPVKMES